MDSGSLRDLETSVAIAEEGSLTAAARQIVAGGQPLASGAGTRGGHAARRAHDAPVPAHDRGREVLREYQARARRPGDGARRTRRLRDDRVGPSAYLWADAVRAALYRAIAGRVHGTLPGYHGVAGSFRGIR